MLARAIDCGWIPHARAGDRYGARSGRETTVGPTICCSEVSGSANKATTHGGGFRLVALPITGSALLLRRTADPEQELDPARFQPVTWLVIREIAEVSCVSRPRAGGLVLLGGSSSATGASTQCCLHQRPRSHSVDGHGFDLSKRSVVAAAAAGSLSSAVMSAAPAAPTFGRTRGASGPCWRPAAACECVGHSQCDGATDHQQDHRTGRARRREGSAPRG